MKFFDLHADIFYDLTNQHQKGYNDTFNSRHYEKMKSGNIGGSVFVVWSDPNSDIDPARFLDLAFKQVEREASDTDSHMKMVLNTTDLLEAWYDDDVKVIVGMEGINAFGESLVMIDDYYERGLRHIGLTWNEQNAFATGVDGVAERGLTLLGRKMVKKIQDKNMILDLAHLNERSFWDALKCNHKPVMVSHSNAFALCPHKRNLKDEQIKAIAAQGGIIGIASVGSFVSEDLSKRNIETLTEHIVHMVDIAGIDSVAFGFDYCDYIVEDYVGVTKIRDASETLNIIESLSKKGFSPKEIKKIANENALKFIKSTGF